MVTVTAAAIMAMTATLTIVIRRCPVCVRQVLATRFRPSVRAALPQEGRQLKLPIEIK
jgi:hypothetical protein